MHRRGNKPAGLANDLAHQDAVALLHNGLGRRTDMLLQRNNQTGRRGQLLDGIAAIDALAAHTLVRMNAAGKQTRSKHGLRSPFQDMAMLSEPRRHWHGSAHQRNDAGRYLCLNIRKRAFLP